jgi:hypothetical protein
MKERICVVDIKRLNGTPASDTQTNNSNARKHVGMGGVGGKGREIRLAYKGTSGAQRHFLFSVPNSNITFFHNSYLYHTGII